MSTTSSKTRPGDSPSPAKDSEQLPTFAIKPGEPHAGHAPRRKMPAQHRLATIEGYEILSELGRGGMAIVFKARQLALNRLVALKMVLAGDFRQPEFYVRFQMEAEAVARLQHPNIIQIFDYSTISGMFPGESQCPYIAFEYVAGGNLSNRIGGLPQEPHSAARIVEILADAVQYAHRCGIIHRDLKPSNVLLTADGIPKISDFGLAKLLDEGDVRAGLTAANTVLGTPEYMSPEQTSPNCRISHSTDIYALGVILYELLTGRRPFEGSSVLETVKLVCTQDPVRPRVLQPKVPRDLETICLKCLRKEPRHRYSTAMALADDLRRFQSGQPIAARPIGVFGRSWKWARRHRSLAALLFFTMALVVFGLPGVTFLWISADQAKSDAIVKERAADAAKNSALRNLGVAVRARNEARKLRLESQLREARLALDQGLALCQQGQVDRGLSWLVRSLELHEPFMDAAVDRAIRANLADWSQQIARPLQPLDSIIERSTAAMFLPDNSALAATDYTARLYDCVSGKAISEPIGGSVVQSIADPFSAILSLAVRADGKKIAIGRTNGVLQLWDVASRTSCRPVMQHKRNIWGMAFCPVSDRVAGAHDDEVVIWDGATGRSLLTLPHRATVAQVAFDPTGKTLLTGAWDGKVRCFNSEDGALLREFPVFRDRIGALAMSSDGRQVVVGGREGVARVYTFPDFAEVTAPLRHMAAITSAVFSREGRIIVTGGRDECARVWEAATGRPLMPPMRMPSQVTTVDVSTDGRRCLVASGGGQLYQWELPASRQQPIVLPLRFAVESLAYTPDGTSLMAGSSNAVYVWNPATGVRTHYLSADQTRLRASTLAPDGSGIFAARWDNTIWHWSHNENRLAVVKVLPLPDTTSLLVSTRSGKLWITNAERRSRLYCLDSSTNVINDMVLSQPMRIQCLAASPDEALLAVGCQDSGVHLLDAHSGKLQRSLPHPDRVGAVAFSPDGTLLATASRDGIARIWDSASGSLLSATMPQQSPVLDIAFSPDGKLLATGGGDHSACFWDTATGIALGSPLWHIDAVQAVAFDPKGTTLATGCRDGNVRLWSLPAAPSSGSLAELRHTIERLTELRLTQAGTFQRLARPFGP